MLHEYRVYHRDGECFGCVFALSPRGAKAAMRVLLRVRRGVDIQTWDMYARVTPWRVEAA